MSCSRSFASARLGDVRQMRMTSSSDDGDELAFEDVPAPLGLAEQVLRPPADDLDPVVQELLHHLLERQALRPAVHQGQHDDADRLLQRRELVELVEDQVRVGARASGR